MIARALVLSLAAATLAAPVAAQSLFNSAGLGVPIEPLDGKARGMGSLGIGLQGSAFTPTDPAALARLQVSTGVMAGQPSWVDFTSDGGATGKFQGNRFPLMGIAYPLLGGMASVQLGSFLDQTFEATRSGTLDLGTRTVTTSDRFVQDGSVSNVNVGYARMLNGDVGVGVTLGRYAGSVDRVLTRSFDDTDDGLALDEYVEGGSWAYRGTSLTAGVSADVTPILRVAASVQLPTSLDARASEQTDGGDRTFDLPIQYRAGASADLFGGLLVSASVAMADWSGAADDLIGVGQAGDTNGFGLGVELTRARLWGKDAPLRFGYRKTGLPFSFDASSASERILSAGFGITLNTTNDIVLAGVDVAVERGRRSGGGITESFWRATISLLAAGF